MNFHTLNLLIICSEPLSARRLFVHRFDCSSNSDFTQKTAITHSKDGSAVYLFWGDRSLNHPS